MASARDLRLAELTSDLALTREAIRTIVRGGQSYSAEGRVMSRADLRALREMETSQATELARLERGSATRVYGVVYR